MPFRAIYMTEAEMEKEHCVLEGKVGSCWQRELSREGSEGGIRKVLRSLQPEEFSWVKIQLKYTLCSI